MKLLGKFLMPLTMMLFAFVVCSSIVQAVVMPEKTEPAHNQELIKIPYKVYNDGPESALIKNVTESIDNVNPITMNQEILENKIYKVILGTLESDPSQYIFAVYNSQLDGSDKSETIIYHLPENMGKVDMIGAGGGNRIFLQNQAYEYVFELDLYSNEGGSIQPDEVRKL